MYEALTRDYPGEPNYPYKLSSALINLSNQQYMLGLDSDSLRTIQRSIEISRRVATDHPSVPEYRKGLGTGLMNCGYLLERAGRAAESMPLYNEARDLYERLVRDHPDVADFRSRLSGVFKNLAFLHEKSGRIDEAFKAAGNSRGILEEVVRDHPENLDYRYNLAWTMHWIGTLHHNWTDRHVEAIPYYRRAIELLERLVRENPEVRTYPATLASTYCYLGQVLRQAGKEPEASDVVAEGAHMVRADRQGSPGKTVRHRLYPFPRERPGQVDREGPSGPRAIASVGRSGHGSAPAGGQRRLSGSRLDRIRPRPGPAAVAR